MELLRKQQTNEAGCPTHNLITDMGVGRIFAKFFKGGGKSG